MVRVPALNRLALAQPCLQDADCRSWDRTRVPDRPGACAAWVADRAPASPRGDGSLRRLNERGTVAARRLEVRLDRGPHAVRDEVDRGSEHDAPQESGTNPARAALRTFTRRPKTLVARDAVNSATKHASAPRQPRMAPIVRS
jgi:hypothetical protein